MKKYIRSTGIKDYDFIDLGRHDGIRYSATVYYDGKTCIKSYHPYDDAEYHWACSNDGIHFTIYINPGKKVESFVADEDREYQDVVDRLAYLDRYIKPRIVHN